MRQTLLLHRSIAIVVVACASLSTFFFPTGKVGDIEKTNTSLPVIVEYARVSNKEVLIHYFPRSSPSFLLFLSGRGETISIGVLESINSIFTKLSLKSRQDGNFSQCSQHRLSGSLHGYRYCRSATLPSQCYSRP